jgi:uncharacterized protein with PIN domain
LKKASLRLLELSADEKARQLYEARLKEQRDILTRERGAAKQAQVKIATSMLANNEPIEKIMMYTGLSRTEIEAETAV